jgi:SAM-dependent methyltransferase
LNDEFAPFPPEFHLTQLEELRTILPAGSRVLDLGAGTGRTALPLREHSCEVLCVDSNPEALASLRRAGIDALDADFLGTDWLDALPTGELDAVTILGNTLMLVHDVDKAARLFESLATLSGPDTLLVTDAIPQIHWPEVAEGYWTNGIDERSNTELRWADDDNVLTLREPSDGEGLKPSDRLHRLWTTGELALLARATGWRAPECSPERTLLVFRRA